MTRKILALLLVLCLLSGCGTPSPRPAVVPTQKIPCCPIAEQEPIVRELPDDTQGDYVVVSTRLPQQTPQELFGGSAMRLFAVAESVGWSDGLEYFWDGETVWGENRFLPLSLTPVPAPAGTEFSMQIPFCSGVSFHTYATDGAVYEGGIKASAVFHYEDGRTEEVGYSGDGLGSGSIGLYSCGTVCAGQNTYLNDERGWESASYKGIDTDVTQTLRGTQRALWCTVQLIHGRLASEDLSDCTLTVADPAGKETVIDCTGDELKEHHKGHLDYDYCTISCLSLEGLQIEDPEGNALDPFAETEKLSAERPVYRSYNASDTSGQNYEALDVPWQESFLFSFSGDGYCRWAGVTYKSPEGQKGTLCVSGISEGTAELFWDGTAILEGDLSDFAVFYIPSGKETVLSLTGKGQGPVTVYYKNGRLTACGTEVEYTAAKSSLSAMPFDPGKLPPVMTEY